MIKSIPGLQPGQTYTVQFAGVMADGYTTPWTNSYDFLVPDRTSYTAPTGIGVTYPNGGGNIRVAWSPPAEGLRSDFDSYEVEILDGAVSKGIFDVGSETKFDFTLALNDALNATPIEDPTFKVRVKTKSGDLGAPATATASYPAVTAVATPVGVAVANGVNWTWTIPGGNSDIVRYYQVDVDTASGTTFDEVEATVYGLNYLYIGSASTLYYARVRSVDVFGRSVSGSEGSQTSGATGSSTDATAPTAPIPGTPTGGASSPDGLAQVTLPWTSGADAESGISGHFVRYKKSTDSAWTTVLVDSTQTSFVVRGLPAGGGTTYNWEVMAQNKVGLTSTWAAGANFTTAAFVTVSPISGAVVASYAGDDLVVTWTDATDRAAYFAGYEVELKPSGSATIKTYFVGTDKRFTLTPQEFISVWGYGGVAPAFANADIKVYARDANGVRSTAVSPTGTAPTKAAPSAPVMSTLVVGKETLKATWGAVSGAVSYNVVAKEGAVTGGLQPASTDVVATSTGTSATWGAKVVNPLYIFRVKATATDIFGQTSSVSASSLATGKPGTPVAPTIVTSTSGIFASWSAVTDGALYEVACGTSASPVAVKDLTSGLQSSWPIATSGNWYTRVRAFSGVGTQGDWGPDTMQAVTVGIASDSAPPAISLSVPTAVAVDAGSYQIPVSWTGYSPGQTVSKYVVEWSTTSGFTSNVFSFTTSAQQYTIPGITRASGVPIYVRVYAYSISGLSSVSNAVTVTSVAPPTVNVPSTPTTAPALGSVKIFWDGSFSGGTPVDFSHTEVHLGEVGYNSSGIVAEVSITGGPTGGTFTLTYSGQTTAAIAYNASSATVQTALINLSNLGSGDVTVTGGPGPGVPYVVTFGGSISGVDAASLTATGSFTGGTSPSVSITRSTFVPSSSTLRGTLTDGGVFTVSGLAYSYLYRATLIAVDKYGNRSLASAFSTSLVSPSPVAMGDIDQSVIADVTSDPVFINYFGEDSQASGWVNADSTSGLTWYDNNSSPTVPGTLKLTTNTNCFAEWQGSTPFLYDPTALYRIRIRAKADQKWADTNKMFLRAGFVTYAEDRVTKNNQLGANSYGTMPFAIQKFALTDIVSPDANGSEWYDFVGYIGDRAGVDDPVGSGTWDSPLEVDDLARYWRPALQSVLSTTDITVLNRLSADDSGFEAGIGTWVANLGCTVAQSGAQFYAGAQSLAVTSTVSSGNAQAVNASNLNGSPVVAGRQYSAMARSRGSVARPAWVQISWYDAAGTYLSNSAGLQTTNTTTGWTQHTVTANAPANAAFASVAVTYTANAIGNVVYWDDIYLLNGTTTGTISDSPSVEIDSFEVYRLDSSVVVPNGILASDVSSTSMSTEVATVYGDLKMPYGSPSTGKVWTALDDIGSGSWADPPVDGIAFSPTAPSSPVEGLGWYNTSKPDVDDFWIFYYSSSGTYSQTITSTGSNADIKNSGGTPWDHFVIDIPSNGILEVDYWARMAVTSGGGSTVISGARIAAVGSAGCSIALIGADMYPRVTAEINSQDMTTLGKAVYSITGVTEGGQVEFKWECVSNSGVVSKYRYPVAQFHFIPYANDSQHYKYITWTTS